MQARVFAVPPVTYLVVFIANYTDRRLRHAAGREWHLIVDVASMVTRNTRPETLELVAERLRQCGLQRVLFASDRVPDFGNDSPKDAWEAFRRLPLTEKEFRTVAENVAPYMR